jgi:hypothetical protein
LKHLEEHLVEAHVGTPVDGAQIVPLVVVAMIEKLLAAASETRPVVSPDQAGKRALPVDGQAFQPFQKLPVQ